MLQHFKAETYATLIEEWQVTEALTWIQAFVYLLV